MPPTSTSNNITAYTINVYYREGGQYLPISVKHTVKSDIFGSLKHKRPFGGHKTTVDFWPQITAHPAHAIP